MKAIALRAEGLVASLALGGIMVLPLAEIFSRKFLGGGIPGSGPIAQNLTLWVGMFGAAIAAREGKLLTLATGEFLPKGRLGDIAHIVSATIGAAVSTMFVLGGIRLVRSDREAGDVIAVGIPTWVADLALPIGFVLIALRLVWRASPLWWGRAVAALGIVAGIVLHGRADSFEGQAMWPWRVPERSYPGSHSAISRSASSCAPPHTWRARARAPRSRCSSAGRSRAASAPGHGRRFRSPHGPSPGR